MDYQASQPVAILGAGSWGTALALSLGRRGQEVHLWSFDPTEITAMQVDGENKRFLPGYALPPTIHPMHDLATAAKDCRDVLIVVPSIGFRSTLDHLKPHFTSSMRLICASKGLDAESGQLLSEVAYQVLGKQLNFAVLSGPSFAREVAAGLPCALMLASTNQTLLSDLSKRFDSPLFNVYPSTDIVGVETGSVVKNVIAIATGIADGLALGANARSALITFGLAEMTRLGTVLGGQSSTFTSLAGLGDLILTCSDNQSRNRRLGLAIGQGKNIQQAEKEIGQVVEGKRNAELVVHLCQQHGVHLSICDAVWEILQGKITNIRETFLNLLAAEKSIVQELI